LLISTFQQFHSFFLNYWPIFFNDNDLRLDRKKKKEIKTFANSIFLQALQKNLPYPLSFQKKSMPSQIFVFTLKHKKRHLLLWPKLSFKSIDEAGAHPHPDCTSLDPEKLTKRRHKSDEPRDTNSSWQHETAKKQHFCNSENLDSCSWD
jgi:hypothetical protein